MISYKSAWIKYNEHLEEQRKKKIVSESKRTRKLILKEVDEIKKKKQALGKCIKTLDEDIAKYSIEAEEKTDLVLLTKVNSFQKTKIEKESITNFFDNALQKLGKDLKGLGK